MGRVETKPIGGYNKLLSSLVQVLSQPQVLVASIEACYVYGHIRSAENLRSWSIDVLRLKDLSLRHCMELPKIASETYKFAQYLEELYSH